MVRLFCLQLCLAGLLEMRIGSRYEDPKMRRPSISISHEKAVTLAQLANSPQVLVA